MTEGIQPATQPQDTGDPDAVERDPAALNSAEDLDEDRLRLDPLEDGMDPPEHWSRAMDFGTTPYEQSQGQDLDHRLQEEQPDVAVDPPVDRSAAPTDDIDRLDMRERNTDEDLPFMHDEAAISEEARRGQTADEGAGSVARELRTPRHVE